MLRVLAVVAVAGLFAAPTMWGGDHVEMEITATGARLEFDCAHGTIDGPIRPDAKGVFRAKGTFTPERGGPSREGDVPRSFKASYTGTVKEDTMTLRIVVAGQPPDGETYSLTRDRPGNLMKCR